MNSESKPVTVIARHRVKPGQDAAFQTWIAGITEECERFEGYLGTEVIHDEDEWVSIFRFEKLGQLESWMCSDVRARWLDRVDEFAAGRPEVRSYDGIGLLFPQAGTEPPPTWKMAVVTFLVIWPLVHFVPKLTNNLSEVPWIQEGIGVFAVVLLASYAGLPLASRALRFWLHPGQ
jgi:antibiotic biosynthesis monooxygenase (ABM) superfamily enzyme